MSVQSSANPNSGKAVALVTGGAIRLGKGIAQGLAAGGYDIALHYNASQGPAAETSAELRALGIRCESFACDFSAADADFAGLIAAVRQTFGRLDYLINSASVYDQAPISESDGALFDRQMAVNLRAPFLLTRAFAEQVERGAILNIVDNKIAFHQYQYAAYLLSKKSLAELTRMAAAELAPRIRVNALAPGVVLPAGVRTPEYIRWREEQIPLQRKGEVAEIQHAVLALLENEFITGQVLFVDGGEGLGDTGRNAASFPGTTNHE